MRYEEHAPPPALRGMIHRVWVLRGPGSPDAPFQRAMPDGRAELIFNFAEPFECLVQGERRLQPRWLLVGPGRRALPIRPTGAVDLIGIRFRPEALSAWLRVRGEEVADAAFAVADLPVPLPRTLPEQLAEAGARERLAIVQRQLVTASPATVDRRLSAAVDLLLSEGGARPEGAARRVGLSRRQLGRLFRDRVGIPPKSLARLGRFQRVLRALDHGPGASLAGVAARAGYFDQAHMSRDFRLFAGIAPRRYLREMRELTRHFLDSPA
jgi:AraC-like DNA-binding protein